VRVLGASAYASIIMSDAARAMVEERGQEDWGSNSSVSHVLFEGHESIPGLNLARRPPFNDSNGRSIWANVGVDIKSTWTVRHTAGDAVYPTCPTECDVQQRRHREDILRAICG